MYDLNLTNILFTRRCVLGVQPQTVSTDQMAILCNFAELVMRVLEGQVMLKEPSSDILTGRRLRSFDAYHQAFAIVSSAQEQLEMLVSSPVFDQLSGQ